ncbi:hypothetical protein L596_011571 [Steinernema carpocapsae]|uniref:Uncharacterized protein n=1 Tax=Steinernema carpocapsae TaxID=34508 RepID=A0A4U5NV75_STECR|nr:hypothetical protein L596_011571 [Steinernema carpocapsae]
MSGIQLSTPDFTELKPIFCAFLCAFQYFCFNFNVICIVCTMSFLFPATDITKNCRNRTGQCKVMVI